MKVIFILLFSLIVLARASGQTALILLLFGDQLATEELHLSVDGAINISDISGLDQGKNHLGINFGLGVHVKMNEKWQFNPQFRALSVKGINQTNTLVEIPSEISPDKTSLRLNYIEFPLMFRYYISKSFFVAAGPQVGFLTSASQNTKGMNQNNSETELKIDAKEHFDNFDYSFPLEIGYMFPLPDDELISKMRLNLFLRFCPGFNNILPGYEGIDHARVNTFQIGLSYSTIKN